MRESAKDCIIIVIFTTLVLIICSFSYLIWQTEKMNRTVPTCPEDAVLVGAGQFENGRWDYYECGPAVDDLIGE